MRTAGLGVVTAPTTDPERCLHLFGFGKLKGMESQEPRPAGRPRIVATPDEFDRKTDAYIAACKESGDPVTITGLALALGFVSKQSVYDYAQYDGFSDSVKRARTLVEHQYEKGLHGKHPTGSIFALKSFGWSDKPEDEKFGPEDYARAVAIAMMAMDGTVPPHP